MNIFAVTKEVRAFANAKGLQVIFEHDCKCPRTDGKKMYVPVPKSNFTEDELNVWRWACLHEAGHNDPRARDCFTLARDLNLNMQSFMGTCLNLIDDNRNEKIDIDILAGKRHIMDRGNTIVRMRNIDSGFHNPHKEKRMRILQTLSTWDARERSSWLYGMGGVYAKLKTIVDEEQTEWLTRLEPYDKRLGALTSAQEEWDLLCEILQSVFDYTDEELEQEKQNCTKPDDGEASEGDGEGDKGAGEGAEGEGEGDGEEGKPRTKKATVKYSDLLTHKHQPSDKSNPSFEGLSIIYAEEDYKRGVEFPIDLNPTVYNYPKGEYPRGELSSYKYMDWVFKDFGGYSFSNKLKKLLQVRAQSLDVHGLKRGKFDRKNIYRAGMTDAGGYSERIFKETIANNILDRAVTVLVDCSGSMRGTKYTHAIRCAILLNESLGKLNVPTEILGFTDSGKTYFPIFKSFDKKVDSNALAMYMSDWGEHKLRDNPDGEALLFAESRLLMRKERAKLLIVLSDGQPSTGKGDAFSHTKDVVKEIEKRKQYDLVAIGIEDTTVRHIYSNYRIVKDSNDLEQAMIEVLKQNIIK